jgi:hypothetical protein
VLEQQKKEVTMNSQNPDLLTSFSSRGRKILRLVVAGFTAILALMFGILAFFVVPAPDDQTATEITGTLVSMSQPHPEYGDITIVLNNGKSYYINRANQVSHLDWRTMLAEVQPGYEVTLTAVTPLAWRMLPDKARTIQPVAGLRTADKVYMDPEIAAATWKVQGKFSLLAVFSLIALIICLLPDLFQVLNPPTPIRA